MEAFGQMEEANVVIFVLFCQIVLVVILTPFFFMVLFEDEIQEYQDVKGCTKGMFKLHKWDNLDPYASKRTCKKCGVSQIKQTTFLQNDYWEVTK